MSQYLLVELTVNHINEMHSVKFFEYMNEFIRNWEFVAIYQYVFQCVLMTENKAK